MTYRVGGLVAAGTAAINQSKSICNGTIHNFNRLSQQRQFRAESVLQDRTKGGHEGKQSSLAIKGQESDRFAVCWHKEPKPRF